jgi:ATP-dependent Lhr-like helicase
VQQQVRTRDSRWFLTTAFAVMGKPLVASEQALAQARLLLQRYGILVKEFYRREHGLLPWHTIFQCLKRLEWQGEIRRGYFVEGLSGIQFALPDALDLLEKIHNAKLSSGDQPVLLSSLDPALPYGGTIDWQLADRTGKPLKINRSPANHLVFLDGRPVLYAENFAQRLSTGAELADKDFAIIAGRFADWLKLPPLLRPKNRIEIRQIDRQGAADGKFVKQFLELGFEKDGDDLILWFPIA